MLSQWHKFDSRPKARWFPAFYDDGGDSGDGDGGDAGSPGDATGLGLGNVGFGNVGGADTSGLGIGTTATDAFGFGGSPDGGDNGFGFGFAPGIAASLSNASPFGANSFGLAPASVGYGGLGGSSADSIGGLGPSSVGVTSAAAAANGFFGGGSAPAALYGGNFGYSGLSPSQLAFQDQLNQLTNAIFGQESGYGTNAQAMSMVPNSANALGPMQVTPAFAKQYAPGVDISTPQGNMLAGMLGLASMLYGGASPTQAAANYYGGPNATPSSQFGNPTVAQYANSVANRMGALGGGGAPFGPGLAMGTPYGNGSVSPSTVAQVETQTPIDIAQMMGWNPGESEALAQAAPPAEQTAINDAATISHVALTGTPYGTVSPVGPPTATQQANPVTDLGYSNEFGMPVSQAIAAPNPFGNTMAAIAAATQAQAQAQGGGFAGLGGGRGGH